MRVSTGVALLGMSTIVAAGAMQAQSSAGLLFVSGNMDIYQSGGYHDGSNGVAPFAYNFPAGPRQVLAFSQIIGLWTCADGTPGATPWGPDGTGVSMANHCYGFGANIDSPVGPFSGYEATDFSGALVGVFLEDTLPGSAPPTLRFYASDASLGGIQTDFEALSPSIGQVFFIGDGLTGTGTGRPQLFAVPAAATRLYLGYIDACSNTGPASPGCYTDNAGAVTAAFRISTAPNGTLVDSVGDGSQFPL